MAAPPTASEPQKPIHTIVLDSSPLLLNTPSLSTLRANSQELVTTPSVLAEIKHEEAKTRIETLYKPFLIVRTPKPDSLKFVRDFARRTGDGAVLSQTDYEIIAVAYEIECERNGGDWRLRNAPGQRRLNGSPPEKKPAEDIQPGTAESAESITEQPMQDEPLAGSLTATKAETDLEQKVDDLSISEDPTDGNREDNADVPNEPDATEQEPLDGPESGDSDDGWITPSNINKHKAKDEGSDKTQSPEKTLQVATMTGDFAMQNVLLQINLNLLSTKTCKRISQIKQFILRCHACFATTKDMSKQFCARCGKPTLTRVSCTTTDKGEVKLHLKANMQWNNRGNVFSVPKPSAGTANQKWQGPQQGGGKGGWGNNLILAEDQKEYIRAMSSGKRNKERDLMDEDTLPSILTGDRGKMGGRVKVGAGRNVNSRKR
jgi:RNA-binding protein NOB1